MKRILACTLSAAIVVTAGGCKDAKSGYEAGYKEAFLRAFRPACEAEAKGKGSSAQLASAYCGCMGDFLTKKYTANELTRILMTKGQAKEVSEAAKSCYSN